ncbi:MAG: DEAD/DEAH box helicase [Candidatus Lokiarchaeota archaeon]|nr:DEAD/DEAH box helicase [Candidatus Lokiarchaeota archaeon]
MSIASRNFFIVFDRKHTAKTDFQFNINFFYLKKFKEINFTFSYISEPFFKGTVFFGLDFKNKVRPLSFNKIDKDGILSPVNPRLFKQFLISKYNKFIAFSNQTSLNDFSTVKEMLTSFQFDKNKIIRLTFCQSCLDSQKFTIMNNNLQIKSFQNQILCSECAYDIILREAKMRGLLTHGRINPKLKNFFIHLILKFKDVTKVLSVFHADFNPVTNKEITLYDIEKKTPIGKEYLNQKFDNLDIPQNFKNVLKNLNLNFLLPIQAISIKNGLLSDYSNLLVIAPTSGGKTLVGELAGISKVLKNPTSKMLYLVPIVALANLRTEEFKGKYKSLNLKVIKRVGESFFDKREKKKDQKDLINADIVIATYEAIDHILRSGNKADLGNIDTIIIDEVQTLIDSERGYLLDGFIARLKFLYKEAQFLFLSATLGEPKLLADKLNCRMIMYDNRPVPIERHLLLCFDEVQKLKHISKLVKSSYSKKSNYGFRGQTIVFSNTRKKCENIASYLQNRGINVAPYHSGLANEERRDIEEKFRTQKIAGVVATAALAAGVDLPASQVIFESLAMGIKWLTVAEFEQMLGRAGRLKKHDRGFAYLLIETGQKYSPRMKETEEEIAIKLLNGKIKDFELLPNQSRFLTELVAFISMFNNGVEINDIYDYYKLLINDKYDLNEFLKKLNKLKLLRIKENQIYKSTRLGQAVAKSFLTTEQCLEIIDVLKNKEKSIIEVALDLKPIKNVYLSKGIVADLAKNVNMRYLSNNFFSGSVLSLMNAGNVKKRKSFSREFIDFISKWLHDIFNCSCKDSPYCDCGKLNFEKMILNSRIKLKLTIEEICRTFEDEYKIKIFKGDVIDYLENLIYSLESIKNILEGTSHLDPKYHAEIQEIPKIISKIKY